MEENGNRRLEARLRRCDGSMLAGSVAFRPGEVYGNHDGKFALEAGCDVVGALRAAAPDLSLADAAKALRDDAITLLGEDAAECRRRHIRLLENLRDRGADPKVRRLKCENAVVTRYILGPVHAAPPWLRAAAGFDAAELNDAGFAAALVAPAPDVQRIRDALAALEAAWPA